MTKPTGKLLFAYNTITALNERIAELEKEDASVHRRIEQIAVKQCADYPNLENQTVYNYLWAIEQTILGVEQANEDVHAEWEKAKALNTEFKEIVAAVAHIGVDFGYGKYELEAGKIDDARTLMEQENG
jgi:hypothetical protein